MKLNPRSGLLEGAPLNDPFNNHYRVEWPYPISHKAYHWFTKPIIEDGHFIRTSIDSFGVLRMSKAKVPQKGDDLLDYQDYAVDQSTIPFMTDYPIMAHWHPWNQIMVSHLSDLD